VTAERWARILRSLGHRARVLERWRSERCDLLVALHATKSHAAAAAFARAHPERPLVVGLAGTDLYRDLPRSRAARDSLSLAWRLVVLQPLALRRLPRAARAKARVVLQSVERCCARRTPGRGRFEVCVLGHLRPIKDPFRPALALRRMRRDSRVVVIHAGAALDRRARERARALERADRRYRWLGELPRAAAQALLARSRLLVQPSLQEGGANAVMEALALGVPVLASRVDGSVGILGPRHPGLFPAGDTRALARLIARCEREPEFLRRLERASARRAHLTAPSRERAAWRALIAELGSPGASASSPRARGAASRRAARPARSAAAAGASRAAAARADGAATRRAARRSS
jgi:putative glycosyltransferase (TIGR04348 family)